MANEREVQVYLEVFRRSDFIDRVALDREELTLGRSPINDVVLEDDQTVSGEHLAFRKSRTAWYVKDLDTTNGTILNGEIIAGEKRLRDQDEILVGNHRLVVHSSTPAEESKTSKHRTLREVPEITRREREVLVELCRPIKPGDYVSAPANVEAIARALHVTEPAVRQHLSRLYRKFGVQGGDPRHKLANEVLKRHVITRSDLQQTDVLPRNSRSR